MSFENREVAATWLDGGQLALTLVQAPCVRTLADAKLDKAAPSSVELVRALLGPEANGGRPFLARRWGGVTPSVLVLPELVFGTDDWAELDELIWRYPDPLVLVAGFGFSRAATLRQLVENPTVLGAWTSDFDQSIEGERVYNGGWCWVHHGTEGSKPTVCHVFLKTFEEQSLEHRDVAGLQTGSSFLRLAFKDLVLYPFICADLVNENPGGLQRLLAGRQSETDDSGRHAVALGALWQKTHAFADGWKRALAEATKGVVVALCNRVPETGGHLHWAEVRDRSRALTGVYGPYADWSRSALRKVCESHVRVLRESGSVGLVVRRTDPVVVLGRVAFGPPGGTTGKQPWAPDLHVIRLEMDGAIHLEAIHVPLSATRKSVATNYELDRWGKRYCPVKVEGDTLVYQDCSEALKELEVALGRLESPECATGVRRLGLVGPGAGAESDLPIDNADGEGAYKTNMAHVLRAVALLRRHGDGLTLSEDPDVGGQLSTSGAVLLVWDAADTRLGEMKARLAEHFPSGNEPSAIFALLRAKSGAGPDGSEWVVLQPAVPTTEPRPTTQTPRIRVDEPRRRRIFGRSLATFDEELFADDGNVETMVTAIRALVAGLREQLTPARGEAS